MIYCCCFFLVKLLSLYLMVVEFFWFLLVINLLFLFWIMFCIVLIWIVVLIIILKLICVWCIKVRWIDVYLKDLVRWNDWFIGFELKLCLLSKDLILVRSFFLRVMRLFIYWDIFGFLIWFVISNICIILKFELLKFIGLI